MNLPLPDPVPAIEFCITAYLVLVFLVISMIIISRWCLDWPRSVPMYSMNYMMR